MFDTMLRSGVPPHIGQSPEVGSDGTAAADAALDAVGVDPAAAGTAVAGVETVSVRDAPVAAGMAVVIMEAHAADRRTRPSEIFFIGLT